MPEEIHPLQVAALILVVILIFNLIIFVHELGHFWAAKWRGLKIDRFQIWFGKAIWKKEVNGVQYGLGWIPAGGFVALPQMAPMEAIEGNNRDDGEPLPAVKPLDKIIVAFAGPLFSFLLALVSALLITWLGKPADMVPTTTVGWVENGSPAEEAGIERGDRILAINGNPVRSWDGIIDSVVLQVATSRGSKIDVTVDRPGEGEIELTSGFEIPETKWWQRRATRQIGVAPRGDRVLIGGVFGENGPAKLAGLEAGDELLAINGEEVVAAQQALDMLSDNGTKPVEMTIRREGEERTLTLQPAHPVAPAEESSRAMIGAWFSTDVEINRGLVHPSPWEQITGTVRMMWTTLVSVASPDSDIGIQHLSGPVGIGKIQYFMLQMDRPFNRILSFMVLININLAILNLLPFPVLDGGHITIATMEAITRRPVRARFLEVLQLAFVFILFGIMLYVTSKDIVDPFGRGGGEAPEYVFPDPG